MNLLLLNFLLAATGFVASTSHPRNPLSFLQILDAPSLSPHTKRVHALSSFHLSFALPESSSPVRLVLEPNHDILPDGALVTYLAADGNPTHAEIVDRLDHKIYKGSAQLQNRHGLWDTVGWARITVLRDGIRPLFEGAFSVHHDSHHVQLSTSYMNNRHAFDPDLDVGDDEYMVLWRDSDVSVHSRRNPDPDLTCNADLLEFNSLPNPSFQQPPLKRSDTTWGVAPLTSLFVKRQIDSQPMSGNQAGVNLVSTIGQTKGCPSTRKVALVGVAADCSYTASFNSSATARSNIITQINSASSLWENAFNISLGLANMTISDSNCPGSVQTATPWNQNCQTGADIGDRLNLFSAWRGTLADSNSHWTLLTNCNSGAEVGLAWLGQACVQKATTSNTTNGGQDTVSGANVVAKTPNEWQVIAHETGHTYGAVHDCTQQTCTTGNYVQTQQCCQLSAQTCDAGSQYIMNPVSTQGINQFSPCTIGNICSGMSTNSVNTQCLSNNKNVVTITGQSCGNGIVEEGEECDCGGQEGCGTDQCCDPSTCKFKGNAVCDDANEDCCHGCQFATGGSVCRPSTGDCDPAETCSGNSPTCPPDTTAPDGQSCSISNSTVNLAHINPSTLQCASGQCTSRDLQCQNVMGAYTKGSNDTYACDSSTCTMSCASPAFGPGTCYGLQQNLLDGTPCGGGGKCDNGQCTGSSFSKEVQSWFSQHKALVIGIACGVGGLIVLAILSCCVSSCRRRRRIRNLPKQPSPPNSWYPPPVPIHASPSQQQGWRPPRPIQPQTYGAYHVPQPPPMAYASSSMRYA